jgi:hypothetical protein
MYALWPRLVLILYLTAKIKFHAFLTTGQKFCIWFGNAIGCTHNGNCADVWHKVTFWYKAVHSTHTKTGHVYK